MFAHHVAHLRCANLRNTFLKTVCATNVAHLRNTKNLCSTKSSYASEIFGHAPDLSHKPRYTKGRTSKDPFWGLAESFSKAPCPQESIIFEASKCENTTDLQRARRASLRSSWGPWRCGLSVVVMI